jgi:hypothetical protein
MREHRGLMSAADSSCPACDAPLAPGARFCAACGRRVGPSSAEISWEVSDRRTFGVLPGRERFRAARIHVLRLLGVVRARVILVIELARARLEAERDRFRIRRRVSALSRERDRRIHRLGEAAFDGGESEVEAARALVVEVDDRLGELKAENRRVEQRLKRRIERARREEGKTEASAAV